MPADSAVSRRDFLKASTALGTGLTIAFYLPPRLLQRFAHEAPDVGLAPNGWVHIGTDNLVTVTVDKSENGPRGHHGVPHADRGGTGG